MSGRVFFVSTLAVLVAVGSAASFRQRSSDSGGRNSNNVNNINNNINSDNNNDNNSSQPLDSRPWSLCHQQSARDLRAHPDDCTKFSACMAGVLISFTCPSGNVFDGSSKSCVTQGSVYDTCMASSRCPPGSSDIVPHPKECAQFFQCDSSAQRDHWEDHLRECDYPMLFNPSTSRCEHYSMVTCGERREPFDPCDYKGEGCEGHAHCVPCRVRHPSCRGRRDGMNAWRGKEGSPHYVVCAAQRVLYHGQCAQEGGVQLFDPVTGTCKLINATK